MSIQNAEVTPKSEPRDATVPVTLLTGFLGAGKTTLLNRILSEQHGQKIAVIENEFGEVGIDSDLLINSDEQIVEVNNGCICCTVRGDLVRILGELAKRRDCGEIAFDRVIIETTGLADPAPVAQTFFIEENIGAYYHLDAIITVVDAKHAQRQLCEHHEAQEQIGFADRILLSKCDLVSDDDVLALIERLHQINARASVTKVHFGETDLLQILDINGFDLNAILKIEPDFLRDVTHAHDDDIGSFIFRSFRPFAPDKLEEFLGSIIFVFGNDLLRYKGVLHVEDVSNRVIFQGVHMTMGSTPGRQWREDEVRESVIVFIGRKLPQDMLLRGLNQCLGE
jgi:G3E family GTPase